MGLERCLLSCPVKLHGGPVGLPQRPRAWQGTTLGVNRYTVLPAASMVWSTNSRASSTATALSRLGSAYLVPVSGRRQESCCATGFCNRAGLNLRTTITHLTPHSKVRLTLCCEQPMSCTCAALVSLQVSSTAAALCTAYIGVKIKVADIHDAPAGPHQPSCKSALYFRVGLCSSLVCCHAQRALGGSLLRSAFQVK